MLQRLLVLDQQGVHPDPVMDVNVGQSIAKHIMEKTKVEKSTLAPVILGITEYEMEDGHENDVTAKKNE